LAAFFDLEHSFLAADASLPLQHNAPLASHGRRGILGARGGCGEVEDKTKRSFPIDIEYYKGFYYISNFLNHDAQNRIIRARDLKDFGDGKLENITADIDGVPYFSVR
jgi:hypothetical protein